ncbi:MAG TPA: TonB-dependent receptor [Bacteroidota bacterium]|nr:TonB-dependent receptor [Bacteroidota bacterium]
MRTLFLFAAALLLMTHPVHAQQENQQTPDTTFLLPPVIVTPTMAKERETPATFSNLDKQQISDRYSVQDIPVLLSELPSMTTYSENGNGIGYNYINLRGFDQRRLSVMVNGVPQNDPEDHDVYWIDFPDLLASTGEIQVQRGAGNDYYGPPAIGGSINLTTNPFTQQPGITLESDFGFQQFADSSSSLPLNTKKFSASVSSGLVDQHYLLYGKLSRILSQGYRINSWVDLNSYFLGGVRIDKNMTTRLNFFGGPLTDGLSYNGLPKFVGDNPALRRQNLSDWGIDSTGANYSYRVQRRNQETESFSQPHFEILNDWHPSASMTISNTLFYYTGDGYYDYDASWADTSALRLGYRYGIPTDKNPANTLVRAFVGNSQWGWLPHVDIDHISGILTLGAEIRFHRSTHWGKISYAEDLPPNFDPDYHFYEYNGEKDMISVYGHESYHLQENLNLMTDLQFVYDRYGIKNEKYLGNTFSLPYYFLNPRVGINDNISREWNGYVSVAYTSHEPRLRNLYAAEDSYFGATPQFVDTSAGLKHYDFTQPLKKPEQLLDLEIGAAYSTSSFHGTADVYWMEFTDELIENGQLDIFGEPITDNAERTRHIGVEIDGTALLDKNFSISGNITASVNRLVHYTTLNDTTPITLDGNPVAGFPDWLGNLRLTYHDDAVTASILAKYVGAFYTDNYNNPLNRNDAYTVLNLEFLYRLPAFDGYDLTVRGDIQNLLNNLYFAEGQGNVFYPAAERNFLFGLTLHI